MATNNATNIPITIAIYVIGISGRAKTMLATIIVATVAIKRHGPYIHKHFFKTGLLSLAASIVSTKTINRTAIAIAKATQTVITIQGVQWQINSNPITIPTIAAIKTAHGIQHLAVCIKIF